LDGTLQACTHCKTVLKVHTIFASATSRLNLGTSTDPVTNSAAIEFVPGPFLKGDYQQLSLGLVSNGTVTACGVSKTAWSELSPGAEIKAGATTLTLAEVPHRWSTGDKLLIAGTDSTHIVHADRYQTEEVTITAIKGRDITFQPAMKYRHAPWRRDLRVHIANVTRNVNIRSQVAEPLSSRGHLMFMSPANDLRWCAIVDLGRTDKSRSVTDPRLDSNTGKLVEGSDANPRGRYADHNHKCVPRNEPARRQGVVVAGSPGWGMVNHDSNCEWDECIAVACFGSAFTTEEGQERGHMRRCLACLNRGLGDKVKSTDGDHGSMGDWGTDGSGFWLQGGLVEVTDCVSFDNSGRGFAIFSVPMNEYPHYPQGLPAHLRYPITVDGDLLEAEYRRERVPSGEVSVRKFTGNTAYHNKVGLQMWSQPFAHSPQGVRSQIKNTTLWGRGGQLHLEYARQYEVDGLALIGDGGRGGGLSKFLDSAVILRMFDGHIRNYDIRGYNCAFMLWSNSGRGRERISSLNTLGKGTADCTDFCRLRRAEDERENQIVVPAKGPSTVNDVYFGLDGRHVTPESTTFTAGRAITVKTATPAAGQTRYVAADGKETIVEGPGPFELPLGDWRVSHRRSKSAAWSAEATIVVK
jgi:hypothetical protein